jgi:hypothetical protein
MNSAVSSDLSKLDSSPSLRVLVPFLQLAAELLCQEQVELQASCFVTVGACLLDAVQFRISFLSSLSDRRCHHSFAKLSSHQPCRAGSDQIQLCFQHFEASYPWFVVCLMLVVAVVWNIILPSTPTGAWIGHRVTPSWESNNEPKKLSNACRRTIRPNLYSIYQSARVPSCGASRSVQDGFRRSRRRSSKMGDRPKGMCYLWIL